MIIFKAKTFRKQFVGQSNSFFIIQKTLKRNKLGGLSFFNCQQKNCQLNTTSFSLLNIFKPCFLIQIFGLKMRLFLQTRKIKILKDCRSVPQKPWERSLSKFSWPIASQVFWIVTWASVHEEETPKYVLF